HDGIKSKETLQRIIAREDIDLIVFDELAVFRNQSTERWKAANALAKTRQWVWGLTGTPTPNAPTDAYAQIKLVNPSRAPRH
ncbi:SNF2-related protein, partial [Pseudomonas aeruginosa]